MCWGIASFQYHPKRLCMFRSVTENQIKMKHNCVTLPCARAKLQQQHTYRVIDEHFIIVQKDAAMWPWAQQRWYFQQTIFLFADFIFASTQNKRRSLTFECRIWYGFEAPIAWHFACSFRHLFLPLPRFLQWFARVWCFHENEITGN